MLKEDGAHRLEQELRQSIASGEFPPGSRLLSVRELASQHALTYGRAHRVLKRLEKQGLLTSRHGGGTFVADARGSAASKNGEIAPCAVVAVPEKYWNQDETLWFREFLRGLESAVSQRGERMLVLHTDRYLQQREELAAVRTHILLSFGEESLATLRAGSGRNVMLVAHDPRHAEWALAIDIDGAAGMRQGVRALSERGHAAIALLSWEFSAAQADQNWWVSSRDAAYADAMAQSGGAARIFRVRHPETEEDEGGAVESRLMEMLSAEPRPTALLCVNDLMARHAMSACARLNLRVPEEISILGYDDEPWTVARGLATFHRPYRELGQMAGEIAVQNQREPRAHWRGALALEPELVVRTSLGAGPQARE